jgi:chorismate mutase
MLSSLPIGTSDLLLVAINVLAFYIVQILFFKFVGSKTNLNVIKEIIDSVRTMVLNLTYNKVDINDFIGLTKEEQEMLNSLKHERDEYNSSILNPLYKIVGGVFLFILFMFFTFPDTDLPGKYLRNTFLTTTNITLTLITICVFSTEFYVYFRFINKMQLITALDILEDPELYEKNLIKYNNKSLYDIYNDNEIQIIHEINKYVNKPFITKKNKSMLVDNILQKFQSEFESDETIQNLINERSKYAAQVNILKQNSKLINDVQNFNTFNNELKKLESFKNLVNDDINDAVQKKIKQTSFSVYNNFIKS